MLTPAQVAALRDKAGHVTDSLVDFLVADIAERISEAGQFTNTAAYEAWRAQKLGLSQKELKKELQKRLKLSTAEINQLFTQVAQTSYSNDIKRLGAGGIPFEENTSLQQILDSSVKLAQDDFTNITQTMGFVGPDGRFDELTEAYQHSCDFAFEKVVNGAQDYNSAVRDATRELAKRGIRVMDYESGVHTSLESAVRRNIMGGLGLMNEQITQQNHDALGCDGWEISAHGGCAPDHEPIQGKQYSDAEYTRLNNSLVRRIGTLNCGHSAMPIILGVNEPQYTKEELEEFRKQNEEGITYNGKHYTLYEATQRQSNLETAIRNRKRRILIDEKLGDKDALQHDQIRLQLLKQEYSRFSKAAGLPMQHERMESAGFTWKHGKMADKTFEKMSASAKEIKAIFGTNGGRDLKKAVDRSIIKLQNGFACFPEGDPLNENVKQVTPISGFFDVAMHGSPRLVEFRSSESKMTARTLATVIRHSPGYTGQNIRLLSCNTGKIIGESYCFAEELANALGVDVTAPNKTLYIFPDGRLKVGKLGDGEFVTYKPNQRRRLK